MPNLRPISYELRFGMYVMDRTRAKQGKEAWLQPIREIQDKTGQYWMTRSSIDPSTGVGLLEGCPLDHLLL
jgi:hypothetical protein